MSFSKAAGSAILTYGDLVAFLIFGWLVVTRGQRRLPEDWTGHGGSRIRPVDRCAAAIRKIVFGDGSSEEAGDKGNCTRKSGLFGGLGYRGLFVAWENGT